MTREVITDGSDDHWDIQYIDTRETRDIVFALDLRKQFEREHTLFVPNHILEHRPTNCTATEIAMMNPDA